MRTTVDLPDELVRAAKSRAAERGESLKDLLARAVTREMAMPRGRTGSRVVLPLVPSGGAGPRIDVTGNADIEAVFADEDAERYGGW